MSGLRYLEDFKLAEKAINAKLNNLFVARLDDETN